jgi:transcriptional regulator with XRE-family HTH domain
VPTRNEVASRRRLVIQIGARLRAARQHNRLLLEEVAWRAGVSAATLSRIETGKRSLDVSLLVVLADAMDVPAASLLGEEEVRADSRETLMRRLVDLRPPEQQEILLAAEAQAQKRSSLTELLQAAHEAIVAVTRTLESTKRMLQRRK